MRSNYKRIGDYIQEVAERNTELKVSNLLGININKFFMPSVANVVGTDMSKYKIVKKRQFACNRMHVGRDKRLPVALWNEDEDIIVSPAYNVFEVIDEDVLYPEYLMMWFSRKEFDRNAWFYTDADVRGGLNWNDFCNLELPVPSIEKQREIVKEYKVLQDRISLNNKLIEKLEDTAQTIYKQWFVDFDFPDENGNPYKSSGGEVIFNEKLQQDIPKEWKVEYLGKLIDYKKGFAFKSNEYAEKGIPVVRVSDFTQKSIDINNCYYMDEDKAQQFDQYKLKTNDIIISTVGSWPNNPLSIVGKVVIVPELADNSLLNQNAVRIRAKEIKSQVFIFYSLSNQYFSDYVLSGAQGSANQASVTLEHLFNYKIIYPNNEIGEILYCKFNSFNKVIMKNRKENHYLNVMKSILLSKLATVEG